MRLGPLLLALVLLLAGHAATAAEVPGPQPPCAGRPPYPAWAALDAPAPNVAVWSPKALEDPGLPYLTLHAGQPLEGRPPPPCTTTGWEGLPFTVALAARFRHAGSADELLARFGAVSTLAGLRYWAASRQRWEPLLEEAHAVRDPESREPRPDLTPEELRGGLERYAWQNLAGPVGGAVYSLRVAEAAPDRLVLATTNVTSARVAGLFPLRPGTLRGVHVLERLPEGPGVWAYYGLLGLATTPDSARTYVNRAAAIFRQLAGIPDTQEPPVWP